MLFIPTFRSGLESWGGWLGGWPLRTDGSVISRWAVFSFLSRYWSLVSGWTAPASVLYFCSSALQYWGPQCGHGTLWQYADIQTRPPLRRGGTLAVDEILNTQDYVVTIITRQ